MSDPGLVARVRGGVGCDFWGGGGWGGREVYGLDGGGVIAELEVKGGAGGVGDGQGRVDEAFWDWSGVFEVGVGGDGVDEVEALAGEHAGLGLSLGAGELGQSGEADDGGEGLPLAFRSVCGDGPQAEGAEGAWAEEPEGIEGGEDGVGILKDERSLLVLEAEAGGERGVCVGDLDLLGAGEVGFGLEEKDELSAERNFSGGGEGDGRGGGVRGAAGEDGDGRARGEGEGGGVEGAAIVELDAGLKFFIGPGCRRRDCRGEGQGQCGGRLWAGAFRRWGGQEGGAFESELLDLLKA